MQAALTVIGTVLAQQFFSPCSGRSAEEFREWPRMVAQTLWSDSEASAQRRANFLQLLQPALQVISDFSGTGAPEFALDCVLAAAGKHCAMQIPTPVFAHACDKDLVCQNLLKAGKSEHVFQDIFD
eukprot:3119626-Amphidinium_carterae.1